MDIVFVAHINRQNTLAEGGLVYTIKKPPKLGKCDEMVKEYIMAIRDGGGIVNCAVMSAAIQGIMMTEAPHRLKCNGGDVDPVSPSLIQLLYRRWKLVMRKDTSSRGAVDEQQVIDIKNKFVGKCEELISENGIPNELIINYDETGIPIVPADAYTMAEKGAKMVGIKGKCICGLTLIHSVIHCIISLIHISHSAIHFSFDNLP